MSNKTTTAKASAPKQAKQAPKQAKQAPKQAKQAISFETLESLESTFNLIRETKNAFYYSAEDKAQSVTALLYYFFMPMSEESKNNALNKFAFFTTSLKSLESFSDAQALEILEKTFKRSNARKEDKAHKINTFSPEQIENIFLAVLAYDDAQTKQSSILADSAENYIDALPLGFYELRYKANASDKRTKHAFNIEIVSDKNAFFANTYYFINSENKRSKSVSSGIFTIYTAIAAK